MRPLILIVDDNEKLLRGVKIRLEMYDYQVLLAYNGVQALEILESVHPDIIVADIMMPQLDGWELFKKVRSNPDWASISFIFLTARSDDDSVFQGKALGAEDYITKPFKPGELVASIEGRLRRKEELDQFVKHEDKPPEEIEIRTLRIQPRSHQVFKGGQEIYLSATEFGLLLFLVQNAGEACRFEQLAKAAYPRDARHTATKPTLRVHISNLRKKLCQGQSDITLITNVRGVGYRFEKD